MISTMQLPRDASGAALPVLRPVRTQSVAVGISSAATTEVVGRRINPNTRVIRPSDISGLIQWFESFDDSTLTVREAGGERFVTHWADKSGAGNHMAQPTAANQPTIIANGLADGRASVRGDGSTSYMAGPVVFTSPRDEQCTIIGVAKTTATGASQRVWCLSNSSSTPQFSVRFNSANKIEVLVRGAATAEMQEPDSIADAADGRWHGFNGRINAVDGRGETALDNEAFQVGDNGAPFSNNLFTTSPTGSTLFAIDGSGGLNQFLAGDIGAVAIFDRALTDAEWLRLRDGYLMPLVAPEAVQVVRLVSTTDCYVAIGEEPTASSNDMFLPAGVPEFMRVMHGRDKIAALRASTDGTLSITEVI
ncbi:MAG: hypothetical protein ACTSX7_14065 [Alphaproteobacteria bacterium]